MSDQTTCYYHLEQIKESGLLSAERMAEVEAQIESRIHPLQLHTGKDLPSARFVIHDLESGEGMMYPRWIDESMISYAYREVLPYVLTREELTLINDDCLAARARTVERENFEKAEKLTEWDGGVFYGDTFYSSLDEALESIDDSGEDRPSYLWAAEGMKVVAGLNTSDLLEDLISNRGWEEMDDRDFEGVEALQTALEAFETANADVVSYWPDHKRAVLVPAAEG